MKSKERKYNIVSVWDDFCQIESSFKESVRYLPVLPENSNVWSLHYADLLLKIGTVLDSVFRDSISTSDYPDSEKIIMNNLKRDDLNMRHYRELYEAKNNLSSKKILYLHDSPQIIGPFSAWASDNSLCWWKAYNNVKHDRSLNITEATQQNTINALAGLFLILLSQREGITRLIDLDVISSPMDNDRLKKNFFVQGSDKCRVEAKAKTLLFGHVFEFNKKKLSDEEILDILSPSHRYPFSFDGGSL